MRHLSEALNSCAPHNVTLTLTPRGRGNWNPVTVKLEGPFDMLSFLVGDKFDLCGRGFWITAVAL